MPSLSHKALQSPSFNASGHAADNRTAAIWTNSNTEDVSLSQLRKFWSGLSVVARRDLLRIDKQTLFEQVRKNLYCSRCHGLLVEGFSQIILYGKSLQAGMVGNSNGSGPTSRQVIDNGYDAGITGPSDDSRDPSVHPWGGLAATRDSMLTVLDCFLDGMPLEVFESARARERERELLYPDACGGGGRGWICQNGSFNGRGHALKETCALHTARLSCEALVDFWSALGDETRRSLLRMKEEDFIEKLMFRFNSKRFCRDCRRNVLREFKEMKELKRSRKEPQCTRWFCAADTVFRYEVSESAVQVDWHDCFAGDGGSAFQRFEWALGTGEGMNDILAYEDVGLSESAYVDNLDLANTSACFITVRGWTRDSRCTELSAKAHALKGQLCVHRRLIVGDGYVSITKGESIQRFFERAEETEEEEDEDAIDKDGNDYEGEASRPQKHAKSPELARDFLLDAATVIFKEQVEKAFREGTARQNAHSIFVCLALSLLEERVRVACKDITSLEKQKKLLEEEEYEKREEEERRERRKQKEKEKKMRRKEKLKSKEKGHRTNCATDILDSNGCLTASSFDADHEEERESSSGSQVEGTESNNSEDSMSARPSSPDMAEARPSGDGFGSENGGSSQHETFALAQVINDTLGLRDGNGAFIVERSKSAKRRTQGRKGSIDISNGSFRRGSTPLLQGENSAFGNSGRIPNAHCSEESGSRSSQGHQKNGLHRIEVEAVPKRVDGWSTSPSYNSNNRHEILQSCACGTSHAGSRSKVVHRGFGRMGAREPNTGSRSGERVSVAVSTKNPHQAGCLDLALTRKSTEHSQGRSVTSIVSERRDPRVGSNTVRPTIPSHSKSCSLDMGAGISNGYHGGPRSSPNGSTGHGSLENGFAVPVAVKPVWTPRAISASIGSNGVAVKVVASGSRPLDSEHGKSDSTVQNAQARPVSPWKSPTSKPNSPKAISMIPVEFSDITKDLTISEAGEVFRVLDANAPVPVQSLVTPDSGQDNKFLATETDPKVGSSCQIMSKPDSLCKTLPMQAVEAAVNAQVEERINTESRLGASREEEVSPHAPSPVVTQGAVNNMVTPVADLAVSQAGHHGNSPPMGTLRGLSPHQIPAAGHPQVTGFPQGNLLRPPSNGMYAFTLDMLPSLGALQHTVAYPPPTFGFFPVAGPWAGLARGSRTGVLPFPGQAGGYVVSGSGGLAMGVPSPISLAGPGSVVSPGGMGHLPAIPDGLNTLRLRDSHQQPGVTHQLYLSRFGVPGRGTPSRTFLVERNGPGLASEGAVAADPVGHQVSESQKPLSNGAASPSQAGIQERPCHNDSPTSTADFSFFHSKWPISGGANELSDSSSLKVSEVEIINSLGNISTTASEKSQHIGPKSDHGVAKSCLPAGEYSLFASAPSKGFGFF